MNIAFSNGEDSWAIKLNNKTFIKSGDEITTQDLHILVLEAYDAGAKGEDLHIGDNSAVNSEDPSEQVTDNIKRILDET